MASEIQMKNIQLRQNYQNFWQTDLMNTMELDPLYCCFACWCGPCASYLLRRRALYNDMKRYKCCAGYMPCSGKCKENKCPEFCLCTEVFCCFGNSVASTRFLLQDELNIQTTECDNCIIAFMLCLQQVACIFSFVAMIIGNDEIREAAHILNCLADIAYCSVCPCMQTQHKIEMDKRDRMFGPRPMTIPPIQFMLRTDYHQNPPMDGYPPPYQQAYAPGYVVQDYPPSVPPPLGYHQNPPIDGYPPPYQQPYAPGYVAQDYPSSVPPPPNYPSSVPPPPNYRPSC
ncbi:hypothetical protein ERO13_D03G149400v2 [Gossypium hirsutum]|uniref:PLAC8 family protein n=1 Tax=Gossypium hirsutum TaxID=3635 RepID=A0A1U8LNA7_GOSHI|nr:uncharacterized protein LOC107929226 [Gossypium hirsutum]KAG4156051.1 hypothetical protein ERO13_D03G149400v2 [Gossypium hirsutum]